MDRRTCPYRVKIVQAESLRREYDEQGAEIYCERVLTETQAPMECEREKCSAWHRGKCRRKS